MKSEKKIRPKKYDAIIIQSSQPKWLRVFRSITRKIMVTVYKKTRTAKRTMYESYGAGIPSGWGVKVLAVFSILCGSNGTGISMKVKLAWAVL